jgi:multidrug efflux pump subunit AcrA (membrane-fusion protein)
LVALIVLGVVIGYQVRSKQRILQQELTTAKQKEDTLQAQLDKIQADTLMKQPQLVVAIANNTEVNQKLQQLQKSNAESIQTIQQLQQIATDSRQKLQKAQQDILDTEQKLQKAQQDVLNSEQKLQQALQNGEKSKAALQQAERDVADLKQKLQQAQQSGETVRREGIEAGRSRRDATATTPDTALLTISATGTITKNKRLPPEIYIDDFPYVFVTPGTIFSVKLTPGSHQVCVSDPPSPCQSVTVDLPVNSHLYVNVQPSPNSSIYIPNNPVSVEPSTAGLKPIPADAVIDARDMVR